MLGLNQTIMLALSMLVITALVGTRDLGQEVYIALTKADTGRGLVAGLCVAFIAIIADRLISAAAPSGAHAAGPREGGAMSDAEKRIRRSWRRAGTASRSCEPLKGGLSNESFDGERRRAARMSCASARTSRSTTSIRDRELMAARAAHAAGFAPEVGSRRAGRDGLAPSSRRGPAGRRTCGPNSRGSRGMAARASTPRCRRM